jgi:hypothetical protein
MITKTEALTEREFHEWETCERTVGPRGGVTAHPMIFRRTGKTQVWKTRPEHFSIPVKHGLYFSARITHENAAFYVVASKCPVCNPGGEEQS